MTRHCKNTFLPATHLSLYWTLEEPLSWHPSRALDMPCALLPGQKRYKDTSRWAALGAEVPGHCQKQLTQTLIVENTFSHSSMGVKNQQNGIELVTRPGKCKSGPTWPCSLAWTWGVWDRCSRVAGSSRQPPAGVAWRSLVQGGDTCCKQHNYLQFNLHLENADSKGLKLRCLGNA